VMRSQMGVPLPRALFVGVGRRVSETEPQISIWPNCRFHRQNVTWGGGGGVLPVHLRNGSALIGFPQNAKFFLCRVSLAFHRLSPFFGPD
jgi:hypothetical protein